VKPFMNCQTNKHKIHQLWLIIIEEGESQGVVWFVTNLGYIYSRQHLPRDDSFYPFLDLLDKDNSIIRNLNHKTFCKVYRNEMKQTCAQDKINCSRLFFDESMKQPNYHLVRLSSYRPIDNN